MSEPLVDALATVVRLVELGHASVEEGRALHRSAEACFFGDRTADAIAEGAGLSESRATAIAALYVEHRVSLKRQDALLLVDRLRAAPDERLPVQRPWRFAVTPLWRQLFDTVNEPVTPV
jgi:hypothetical protein